MRAGDVERNPGPDQVRAEPRATRRGRGRHGRRHRQRDQATPAPPADLELLQLNCNGVWSRLVELRARLAKERPHVVLLQETKLRPGADAPTFPGYNLAARADFGGTGPPANPPLSRPSQPPTAPDSTPPPPTLPPESLAEAMAAVTTATTTTRPVSPPPAATTTPLPTPAPPPPPGTGTTDPRPRLPPGCRIRFRDDRSRWCGNCRAHRRGGCDFRRLAGGDSTPQGLTPDADTTPTAPTTPTTPAMTPPPANGNTVEGQRRTAPQLPAACRTRFRDDKERWCGGCRSRKRGCDARRAAATTTPIATGGDRTSSPRTAGGDGARAHSDVRRDSAPPTEDPSASHAGAGDRSPGTGPAPATTGQSMDQGGTGQGTGHAPPPVARRPPAPSPSSTATARGGIITLVRDDIPYSVNESPYRPLQPDSNTQCSSTTIHATKAFNLTVINIYVPPARWAPGQGTQEQIFQPDGIRTIGDTVVGGDFNAHSLSWDPFQPESATGEAIEEWARDSNLLILNDGSPTRHNPSTTQSATTEGRSAPDVTMLSQSLARSREVKWATQRGIGSDHLPILTTISASCTRIRGRRGGRGRFCHRRADWTNFRLRCDQLISDWSNQPISLSAACRRLTDTILQAARSSVPFGSGSGRRPPFWNAECQAVVDARERALAAATRSGHSSEDVRRYQAARAAADHVVAQQKTEFFNKKLAEMGPDKDMWSLDQDDGRQDPPSSTGSLHLQTRR